MSRLRSPYIAEIFGYSWERGAPIVTIVMEYFPKGDLFHVLHKTKDVHLSIIQRMRMARHCAIGVYVLHKEGILHRDIKSLNVLVSEDYSCKIADFGMAKLIKNDINQGTIALNTEGKGTPVWMAPEVKKPQQAVSAYSFPADIYSLGIVLYEIFERDLPWDNSLYKVVLPANFFSSNIILPMMNQNPVVRPNAEKVATSLDNLIRQTVLSIYKLDHKNEIDIKDNSLLNLYQNLLLKSPQEVDKIIEQIRLEESKKRTEEETLKFPNGEKKKDKSQKIPRKKDKIKESQKTPKTKRIKEDKKKEQKKKPTASSLDKGEKIESLEDDLFTKFDIKEAKQRSKIFRFSPKKKKTERDIMR
jgi:serine/threonine protein kinase